MEYRQLITSASVSHISITQSRLNTCTPTATPPPTNYPSGTGWKEDGGATQAAHKRSDTQMTEALKCPLHHISGTAPLYLPPHTSLLLSLNGSVCVRAAEEECRRHGRVCLGRFKGDFYYLLASWTHLPSEAPVSII